MTIICCGTLMVLKGLDHLHTSISINIYGIDPQRMPTHKAYRATQLLWYRLLGI